MIVCSCNVLTEADVRHSVANASSPPKEARDVYPLLGCAPQCGKCAPTIERILREINLREDERETGPGGSTLSRLLMREGQTA
jgi:bacterioferritin-associated ferredoxin